MALFGLTTNYNFKLIDFDVATWHDDEYDNWRSVDGLLTAFFGDIGFTGVWANSTAYTVGQRAVDEVDGKVYEVLIAHTSAAAGLFSADRTTNPTFWEIWLATHSGDMGNPHSVTKTQVGLGNVDDVQQQPLLAVPSQVEAEAGTATTQRVWTAERVRQAIAALASAAVLSTGTGGSTPSSGSTTYMGASKNSGTEGLIDFRVPYDGTIRNLYCNSGVAPGSGEEFEYTVRVQASDTAVTCTNAGASDTTAEDTTNSVAVSAGDAISVKLVTSGSAGVTTHAATFEFIRTV